MSNDIPRRNDLLRQEPAELAIGFATYQVETLGADPLLTEAVVLLGQAKDKVADYIDKKGKKDETST